MLKIRAFEGGGMLFVEKMLKMCAFFVNFQRKWRFFQRKILPLRG
jgi:hypothetical protein